MSESLLPSVTDATVPSSFSSTVTGKLPVRPLAVLLLPPSAAGAAAGAAGSSTMPWLSFQAAFTALITPRLLMVAPVTISTSASATAPVLPTNCARNLALFCTWPRKGASSAVLGSPISMPVMAAVSSTLMVTSKVPVRPLPWAV